MLNYETLTDEQIFKMSQACDFYVYDLDFAALLNTTTQQNNLTIQTDSSFIWMLGTYQADIAGAAQTESTVVVPNVTVQIQDASSGRQLFSAPVPLSSVFGIPGQPPYVLPICRFFRANTQLTVTLTSYEASVDYNIRLQLHGMKRYLFPQGRP